MGGNVCLKQTQLAVSSCNADISNKLAWDCSRNDNRGLGGNDSFQFPRETRAAKVSPQAAITGNINQTNNNATNKVSNTKLFHVDTAMGLHHAFSNKKSMVLIAGSFAQALSCFYAFLF